METCSNCQQEVKAMRALGHWPRCQHLFQGRAFDPHAQCIFKARHKGCHKAEYPTDDQWTCDH